MKRKKITAGKVVGLTAFAFLSFASCGTARAGVFSSALAEAPQTLRMVSSASQGPLDPQINYMSYWDIFQMVWDGLVTFRKTSGKASSEIVPDLAISVPTPTDHGLVYSFTLRRGIRFSNGQFVTVQAVKHSFIRLFKILSPNAGAWYSVIQGGQACMKKPQTCTLPGIVINPKTNRVVFHLSHRDPEFLYQLAVPFAVIVPADTPDKVLGTMPPPGTGTYMVQSYNPDALDPASGIVLVRNPYFREWSAEAQPRGYPNKILYNFGLSLQAQTTAVERGEYDWMFGPVPPDRLAEIATRYPKQVHIESLIASTYVALNVNIPPFNNYDARLAVNYAVNRADIIKIIGGRTMGRPSCQILPPGVPGYQPYCPYTKNPGKYWQAPDWAKAEYYMKKSGMIGQKVLLVTTNTQQEAAIGTYLQSVFTKLGFVTELRELSPQIQYNFVQNTANNVQASLDGWYMDYPTPSDFLNTLFGCSTFRRNSNNSPNISGFCNRQIQAQMNKANNLSLTNKKAADHLWAKIDREVTDQAPAITLYNPAQVCFVSKRYHHFVFSKVYMGLPQLARLS